ncbi:MAG TPA: hypothetical protein VF126_15755 [Acidobacteriaceae bacterium]
MMRDRLPFSHLLPLIDLALLVILVFVPITMTALHVYEVSKGADPVHIRSGAIEMTFPRSQIIPWSIRAATIPRARRMMIINLPGALFQWLISLPTPERHRSGWHPQALLLETWQALVFPFFALPFWWLVGCGLDGLISKERLHWSPRVIGTILFVLCLAALIAFCLPMTPADRRDLALPMKGFISWTIGLATLPTAWILQSFRGRNSGAPIT